MARYFEGGLAPAEVEALRVHTRGCAACRAHYDRLARAEHALHPQRPADAVPAPRLERLLDEARARARPAPPSRARWGLLAGATAALACSGLALWLWWPGPPPDGPRLDGELLAARGFADTPQAIYRQGVRTFCVRPPGREGDGQRVVEVPPLEFGPREVRCPSQGSLYFTASNLLAQATHVVVFGLTPQGAIRWYYPRPEREAPPTLPPGVLDQPLGRGVMLGVHHQAGPLQVYALFSDQPLSTADVERAAPALARGQDAGNAAVRVLRFVLEVE